MYCVLTECMLICMQKSSEVKSGLKYKFGVIFFSRACLGLLFSSDMSFTKHIESICSKARKVTGLLYRRFNKANSDTLLQLYLTMVRPHLKYASPVWNPSTRKQVKKIEDVEKFAMKVVTRRWDAGYQELLNMVNIPSIESRRLQSCM